MRAPCATCLLPMSPRWVPSVPPSDGEVTAQSHSPGGEVGTVGRAAPSSGAGWTGPRRFWGSRRTRPELGELRSRSRERRWGGPLPAHLNPASRGGEGSGQVSPLPTKTWWGWGARFLPVLDAGPALPLTPFLNLPCELVSDTFWRLRGISASANPSPPAAQVQGREHVGGSKAEPDRGRGEVFRLCSP